MEIFPNPESLRSKVNQKRIPKMDLVILLEMRYLAHIQESILIRKAFRCGQNRKCMLKSSSVKDLVWQVLLHNP